MPLKIGIVGLPNVGKSTLFQALTKKKVDISNYPFCTIEPNVGIVAVPDERLTRLAKLLPEAQVLPAVIEIIDVAGLVKDAAEGKGLGNQFLSHLFPMDALIFLIRCFHDPKIVSLVPDPSEQLQILRQELTKKDEEISKRHSLKNSPSKQTLVKLAQKPLLVVCNIREGQDCTFEKCEIKIDCQFELELSEMSEREQKELEITSNLPQLIRTAYKILNLITFYTLKGGKELRAWPIKQGTSAPEAGGAVHSDFREKFIRAEVISWEKLVEAGSWQKAQDIGWIRAEGKEYVIQDGDVVEFKI